ncbi:MAG: tRNA (adenine-N1)-methyltransferase [Thaumarchaeota archaeon]|nr:tRNA (adenine-N1)-methyltransferase [Nitrososphaerota archaeon]MCL5317068.1 tRNA (adenine-N1)-methyltransferase [Nitrososphaerota archaeon]
MSSNNNTIHEGDYILIFLSRRKNWLLKVEKGRQFHTHRGIIDLTSVIGLEPGSTVQTSLGETVYILKPVIKDLVLKSSRKTQVVYPKDLGAIAAWTGLSPGKIVVESGTGSGALTIFAANLVRPNGHIYSYDLRPEFQEVAKKNIERAGLGEYITLKQGDAKQGLDVTGADIALVDVGDPWTLVKPMKNALKGSGTLAAVIPTMNQVEKMTAELLRQGFVDVQSIELIEREIEARVGMTRPAMRMVGHTAYLTFARKSLKTTETPTEETTTSHDKDETEDDDTAEENVDKEDEGIHALRLLDATPEEYS